MKTAHILLITFIVVLYFFGCSEKPTEVSNYYYLSTDSLSNPNIKPQVIFTHPTNGAVGPFDNLDIFEYPAYPRIMVQFNKLIDIYEVGQNDIYLQGDDQNIDLELVNIKHNSDFLTNILVFAVHDLYRAGKHYKLVINKSLNDVHGYHLDKSTEITFLPEPHFRAFYVFPTQDEVEPLKFIQSSYLKIQIWFNSKIDSNIFKYLSISPPVNGSWSLKSSYSYTRDSIIAYFSIEDTLKYNKQYTVFVSEQARDIYGNIIKEPVKFSFKTTPFSVKLFSYSGYTGPGGFRIYNDFDFEFNAPVDTASVRQAVSISPAIDFYLRYHKSYQDPHFYKVNIELKSAQMKANTVYTIQFNTKLKSIYGDHLPEPYRYSFRTGN